MCANHEHHLGACKNLTAVGGPEPGREGESLCVLTPEQKLRINPPPCFSPREEWSQAVDTESQSFETITGVSIEDFTGNSCR